MSSRWIEKISEKMGGAVLASPGGFHRYLANTGWLLGGQGLSLAISFFVGAWVIRSLGPQDFGVFSYSLSFAGLFSMLAGLGIDGILARDLVRYPQKQASLLGSGLIIKIVGGLLAWTSATAVAWYIIPSDLGRAIVSLIAFGYLLQSLNIIDTFFRSRVESKFGVRAQAMAVMLVAIFKIYIVASGLGLAWLAAAYSTEILLSGIILVISYRVRQPLVTSWTVNFSTVSYLLMSSWPLFFSGLAAFFLLRIDQVMIGHYLSAEAVGLYAAGVKLSELWYFLPGVITAAIFPALVNGRTSGSEVYSRRVRYLYLLLGSLALIISLVISSVARPLIMWLLGNEFLPAVPVAVIYVWSTIGWFLFSALWYKLMAENRLQLIFLSSLVPLIANVVLNIWLIPRYGIMGAAISTLISYSSVLIFIVYSHFHENTASYN